MGAVTLSETFRKAKKALRLLYHRDFRRGLFRGIAASVEHERALAALSIHTVVDIGANVGQFSLLGSFLYPHARIYAFEPQLKPASVFERLFSDAMRVTLFRSAIGTRSGRSVMHVSRQDDSSSLLPISAKMSQVFPGTEEVGVAEVSIGPLASFLTADEIVDPALLKIDVQGAELDVLQGCDPLLGCFRYIYVELSFVELYKGQALCHQVVTYLDQKNFHLIGIHNVSEDANGQAVQADFLFRFGDQVSTGIERG